MNRLRMLMRGRNGIDQFGTALLVFTLLLAIISSFSNSALIAVLPLVPLIYFIYRTMSRKLDNRRRENMAFLNLIGRARAKTAKRSARHHDKKTHKYLKCSSCKTTLRVPRGKGRIIATCPNCGEKKTIKT